MALVNFTFDGIKTTIKCVKEDKMKNICDRFVLSIDKDINSLYFLYNGNQINNEFTFYEQANLLDKQSLEMNILVMPIKDTENKKGIYESSINETTTKNQVKTELNLNENINVKEEKKLYNNIENNDDNVFNSFDIKLKRPILKIKYYIGAIYCVIVLNDGRFATSLSNGSIIIYNDKTYKPDLVIQAHDNNVYCLLQLSSGILASCSGDATIKMHNIKCNNYQLLQTLNYHKDCVCKIIEINNKNLISCSWDSSIIIYSKDNNNKYTKDYQIATNGECYCLIQTKENEICYDQKKTFFNHSICFYDLLGKKVIKVINDLNIITVNTFNMIAKDLLLIAGEDKLSIINVNQYNLIRIVDVPGSSIIFLSFILNRNFFLTSDFNRNLKQWKLEGDNIELISTKENAQREPICSMVKLRDGHILSCSTEGEIKIW